MCFDCHIEPAYRTGRLVEILTIKTIAFDILHKLRMTKADKRFETPSSYFIKPTLPQPYFSWLTKPGMGF